MENSHVSYIHFVRSRIHEVIPSSLLPLLLGVSVSFIVGFSGRQISWWTHAIISFILIPLLVYGLHWLIGLLLLRQQYAEYIAERGVHVPRSGDRI